MSEAKRLVRFGCVRPPCQARRSSNGPGSVVFQRFMVKQGAVRVVRRDGLPPAGLKCPAGRSSPCQAVFLQLAPQGGPPQPQHLRRLSLMASTRLEDLKDVQPLGCRKGDQPQRAVL